MGYNYGLPASQKFAEPNFFFYPSTDLPTLTREGSTIKILCGDLEGTNAPTKTLSPAYLFEVKMPAGTSLNLPITQGYSY